MAKTASIQALTAIAPVRPRDLVRVEGGGRSPLWDQWGAGQMLELSGSASGKLSTVARLIVRAQAEGEPVAWVGVREEASFYAPDFAEAGVDLGALVVVRMPLSAGSHAVVRATEVLLRSGAFGLVIVDLSREVPRAELAWQSRLSGLLRMHGSRVVLLTTSRAVDPSLGPLVSLRIEPSWREAPATHRVVLSQHVLKSKLGGTASISPDVRTAPVGSLAAHLGPKA